MKRCDPNAKARCPEGKSCELYAEYADGSWCDVFNEMALKQPLTNADRIRAMTDEELADELMTRLVLCQYCAYQDECENGEDATVEKCREGIVEWLKQPAEETP